MTYDQAIETMCTFLRERVAPDILLKLANDNGDDEGDYVDSEEYVFTEPAKMVHPVVCPIFTPLLAAGTDFMPESGTQTAPALIVTAQTAENDGTGKNPTRQLMRIMAVVWDDGVIVPVQAPEEDFDEAQSQRLRKRVEGTAAYRAAANLCERVLRALESTPAVGEGMYLQGPFRMGMYSERDGAPDYYPYCIGWVECIAEYMRYPALDPDIARMVE
ncbi:MAG: hypothetical protein FWE98_08555 [Oscillospiraceae bacterium]|nr:hypothetical protein [Oscillospiraceae bacterium]